VVEQIAVESCELRAIRRVLMFTTAA